MELKDALRLRRSIRKYKDIEIDDATIIRAIDNARFYPSWKNSQTVRFHLVKDKSLKHEIAESCLGFGHNTNIIESAPAIIAVLTIKGRSGFERDGRATTTLGSHFESFDAGLATSNLMYALLNENIGSCVLGIYDEERVRALLEVSDEYKVSCLVSIGYPDEEPLAPKRKEVSEILTIK